MIKTWVSARACGPRNRMDCALKVWELETRECIVTFTCDSAAWCCAISDFGKLIVAGDAGGHVDFLSFEEPKRRA